MGVNYSLAANKTNLALIILFCLVQAGMVATFGIYTQEEATKYIYEADFFLQNGIVSQPKYVFYSGYIFLRILMDSVVVINGLVAGISGACVDA